MAFASISTAAIALTIFGVFVLLAWHLHAVVDEIPRRMEIHAFAFPNTPRERVEALVQEVQAMPGVARVRLVPKETAWAEYQKHYPHPDDLQGLSDNPLPDKLEIVAADPSRTVAIAEAVRDLAPIKTVKEEKELLQKLLTVANVVRWVGMGLALLLALGTMAIIHNAIRMTLFARRRDIRVMQLVGATDGFIRFPFVVEGMVEGAAGGLLACGALTGALHYFTVRLLPDMPFVKEIQLDPNIPIFLGLLVAGGALLGMAGSLFSLRKFLRAA